MNPPSDVFPSDWFPPGSAIGVLGGGQLGRMFALTAKRMGYRVHVFSPDADSPAGQVADVETVAAYTDEVALQQFADCVDVVTLEFENIPSSTLERLVRQVPVYPQPQVLQITQNRVREKTFLARCGFPVTPFCEIGDEDALRTAITTLGLPGVLKTAGFGYDGKGQSTVHDADEAIAAYRSLNGLPCILERLVSLETEISVIAARIDERRYTAYRPVENRHRNHILDVTVAPAQLVPALEHRALSLTRNILDQLKVRGVLCVEFFITREGELLINELAPRPHNSGHYTLEAAVCHQFEQQLRAVCGLPLGDPSLRSSAAMVNLMGELWTPHPPDWPAALKHSSIYLHLYGKVDPRPGRKMGHLTALGRTPQIAADLAVTARRALTS